MAPLRRGAADGAILRRFDPDGATSTVQSSGPLAHAAIAARIVPTAVGAARRVRVPHVALRLDAGRADAGSDGRCMGRVGAAAGGYGDPDRSAASRVRRGVAGDDRRARSRYRSGRSLFHQARQLEHRRAAAVPRRVSRDALGVPLPRSGPRHRVAHADARSADGAGRDRRAGLCRAAVPRGAGRDRAGADRRADAGWRRDAGRTAGRLPHAARRAVHADTPAFRRRGDC